MMPAMPPPAPSPHLVHNTSGDLSANSPPVPPKSYLKKRNDVAWEQVRTYGYPPCQRSLHAAAEWKGFMFIFGGYDGTSRCNDLHRFDFETEEWKEIEGTGDPPAPRDRHIACVFGNGFYVFGGFDGHSRVNDMHRFDMITHVWTKIEARDVPSPRHSHAAAVYGNKMYVFGGYDGAYKNDFYEFNFLTETWQKVPVTGDACGYHPPKARYRGTVVVRDNELILHGGHDGTRHLADTHIYHSGTQKWREVSTSGAKPKPRDSHVAVIHKNGMYILGGSTGTAMNDFHRLDLDSLTWTPVGSDSGSQAAEEEHGAGNRFCHVGVMHDDALYIFGGYDGSCRLNDFQRYQFMSDSDTDDSTLIADLGHFVNSELLSDITFIVENRRIYAHKLLCLRCPYFYTMLTGEYMERHADELVIEDVRYEIFLLFLQFLYTDQVDLTLSNAMELFQTADRYSVDRLKTKCEVLMLNEINVESAPQLLLAADLHNANLLRERCILFMMSHFDEVSVTSGFEEMSRANLDLNLEIIRRRLKPAA